MKPINQVVIKFLGILISPILLYSVCTGQEYRKVDMNFTEGNFFPSGLNSKGQVCGSALVDDVNFINHAFRREIDGTFTMLALGEKGTSATASAINDLGQVIGNINTTDFELLTVIWLTDSTYRILEQPEGFTVAFPKDLNNNGEAVGHTLTDPPTPYYWDATGSIYELPHSGTGAEAVALNNHGNIVGRVFDSPPFLRTPQSASVQENSLPMFWERTSDPFGGGQPEFNQKELARLGGLHARANDISDNNIIVGESSIDESVTHATVWIDCEPRDVSALIEDPFIDDLNGGFNGVNGEGYGIGFQEFLFGDIPVKLGIMVNFNTDPFQIFDAREYFAQGAVLPSELMDISERFHLLDGFDLFASNFTIGICSDAAPGSGIPGLDDFSSFSEATIHLQQFIDVQSIFPVFIYVKPDIYLEDRWMVNNWSSNVEFRSEGDGTALLPQINIPEGVDATLGPRQGILYDVKGITSAGNIRFLGAVNVECLELNGEQQKVSIGNPGTFNLRKLKIDGSDVIVDANLFLTELDLNGTLNGTTHDFGITIKNNGSSNYSIGQLLPGSGFVQVKDGFSWTGGFFTHQIGGENYSQGDYFFYPNGLETEEGFKSDQATLEYLTDKSWGDHSLTFTTMQAPNLDNPNITDENFVQETLSPRVWKTEVRFNWKLTDNKSVVRNENQTGIITNIRIPAYDLDPADDPNQYRLLKYDCGGNFLNVAGSFLPPIGEEPDAVMYTGMIDGVLNITHQNVSLDTCNYFVFAKGSISTSVLAPDHIFDFNLTNYPNPFSENTTISYILPEAANVDLALFSLSGQRVSTLLNESQQIGNHQFVWDRDHSGIGHLPAGAYVLKISVKELINSSNPNYEQSRLIILK